MVIRALGVLDLPGVASLGEIVPLDLCNGQPSRSALVWDMVTPALRALLLPDGWSLTFVVDDDGRVSGLIQVRQQARPSTWSVTRLALTAEGEATDQTVAALLGAASQAAAEHGALRLFLRTAPDSPFFPAFRRAGFTVFGHEDVYILPRARGVGHEGEAQVPVRPQHPRDAWGLHHLYMTLAPRLVQQAEELASSDWEDPIGRTLTHLQRLGERRWVMEGDGRLVAWVRVSRLERRLELLVHPEAYGYAPALIRLGLRHLSPLRNIRCLVPEYQGALGRILEDAGFHYVGTQAVLVKHLMAPVREGKRVVTSLLERTLEPIAKAPLAERG